MIRTSPVLTDPLPPHVTHERRMKPRVRVRYQAKVCGRDAAGEKVEFLTWVENISSSGLYMNVCQPLEPGITLYVTMRLAVDPSSGSRGALVAFHGYVQRVKRVADGTCGVGLVLTHHRVLYGGNDLH